MPSDRLFRHSLSLDGAIALTFADTPLVISLRRAMAPDRPCAVGRRCRARHGVMPAGEWMMLEGWDIGGEELVARLRLAMLRAAG